MKYLLYFLLLVLVIGGVCTYVAGESSIATSDLRANGAFGFPQKEAKVLYDQPLLRFSVWNNGDYLLAQAILWTDNDASLGKTADNREIGDWSELLLDLDADGKPTPHVDRDYMLNPWPGDNGLHYDVCLGRGSTTGIQSDSKGRGAIRYLEITGGTKVRVDTYLIPLSEMSRKIGDEMRLCYWGYSPTPALTVNSAGFERGGKSYYGHHIPLSQFNDYVLKTGGEIDVAQVPDGRADISFVQLQNSLLQLKKMMTLKVGQAAPELSAKEWVNLKGPSKLADLRGKVVLVEFWATWCGPCIECIPHLNELQRKYAGKDFQLLSLVLEGHETMDKFLTRNKVEYPIGLESSSLEDYVVTGIPQAFVIDQKGKIIWSGHSASPDLDKAIATALAGESH